METLTQEAFADFGQVIDSESAQTSFLINGGTTQRFHDLAQVEIQGEARGGISIFRAQPRHFPFAISMLERHPYGSQAFMPLNQRPYLVVVAPALDASQPDISQLRLFKASGTQGVNYALGTWHHPLICLEETADFLVVDRVGQGQNCDEYHFTAADIKHIAELDF